MGDAVNEEGSTGRKKVCDGLCSADCHLDCRKRDRKGGYMKRKVVIGLLVVLAVVSASVMLVGCSGNSTPSTTNAAANTSAENGGTTGGEMNSDAKTTTTTSGTNQGATSESGERKQIVGDAAGEIASALDAALSFTTARPLYDGFVYTLSEGYDRMESHKDGTGFEQKMEEFYFYPQIDDTSEAAQNFNEAMKKRLQTDYDRFSFRATYNGPERSGTTYRAYLHKDLVSIVFVEWSSAEGDLYSQAYTYVYDKTQKKFLTKGEIIEKSGLKEHEFSELFDMWFANGPYNLGAIDGVRMYAPGLLQMWALDYHLPLGEWVDVMTRVDANLALNAGVIMDYPPKYGLFFDDAGDLVVVKSRYDISDPDPEKAVHRFFPDAEGVNWLREMPYETEELEVFHELADRMGGDQSRTQAFVIFLGNKRDPEMVLRRLAAAAEIPAMDLDLRRITSNIESYDGEIEMYLIIPRYPNAVMGVDSAIYWEENSCFGPVIAIKDSRETFLHYVYRGFYSNVMLKNDMERAVLDTGRDEGGFVDASDYIGMSDNITSENEAFVKNFYEPWNQ